MINTNGEHCVKEDFQFLGHMRKYFPQNRLMNSFIYLILEMSLFPEY